VLKRPADESEDGVAGGFGREVRVRVQAVQGPHAGEGDVTEHVLGDQRRPERENGVRGEHRGREPAQRQRVGARKRHQIGTADDQHQRLEAAAAEVRADAGKRTRQPVGPAAAVGRHVTRRGLRSVEREHGHRCQQCQQRDAAEEPGGAAQPLGASRRDGTRLAGRTEKRRWPGRLHEPILTAPRSAGVHPPMYAVDTAAPPGTPGSWRAHACCNPRGSAG
jgi:hypothetical protein